MLFGSSNWENVRDAKQAKRSAEIDKYSASLPTTAATAASDADILSSNATEIVAGIKAKRWTATGVLECFIRAAIRVQRASNAVTEIMFEEALEAAKALDQGFGSTGELVGELHGLPITLKDQIAVAGVDSTLGFSHEADKPDDVDASLVKILRAAGAIPFCKTNIPQTMLSFESSNPIFGRTTNPHDSARTSGGSSSGEAAMLGSDGSALGFGSDIGGSLRIPAHFSGCFGFKPSAGRFSTVGAKNPSKGFAGINSVLGPMGRSVADLKLACKVVFDASASLSHLEPVPPVPFREVELKNGLRIGYYFTDGFCRASPASRRAVTECVDALTKLGHDCVEFTPLSPVRAMEIFVAITSAGGYEALLSNLHGDPQDASLFLTTLGVKLPGFVRGAASSIVGMMGDPLMAKFVAASRVKTVDETQKWQAIRDNFISEFRRDVWQTRGFDAIVCSVQAGPAILHGASAAVSPLAIGTILYNVVDSAVGVLPVTFVDAEKDKLTDEWRKLDSPGSKLIEDRMYGANGAYDIERIAGLPIGVQVVGPAWSEEKVLAIMALVDSALGERGFSPGDFARRLAKKEATVE